MSCCGQQRQALRSEAAIATHPPTRPSPVLRNPTPVVFHGDTSIVVRGATTGLIYVFPGQQMPLAIDELPHDCLHSVTPKPTYI